MPRSPIRRLASLAWRESRLARRRLLLSMSSIMLGVAALVAIDSLAQNATRAVREQARSLVGGDVAIGSRDSLPTMAVMLLDSIAMRDAKVAYQTSFVSMARGLDTGDMRLVQLRAVTRSYPFFGAVTTTPESAWSMLHRGRNAIVDPAVLDGLGLEVGDSIALGELHFAVIGTIRGVASDVAITTTLGPRVYIPERFVAATRLLGFGSRSQRDAVLQLAPSLTEDVFAERFASRFAQFGLRVRTAEQNATRVTATIGQLRNFLALVGLIALLLGGIGVASGVRAFVLRKIDTVAVLRCLGGTSAQVLAIYVAQAVVLGLAGATIGALAGVALQFAAGRTVASYLPVGMTVRLEPRPVLMGIAVGMWVALVCALQPLLALRRVSPLQALRRDEDAVALGKAPDWASRLVGVATLASLLLVTVARARRWQEGVGFAVAILVVIGALWVAATLLSTGARRFVRPGWPFPLRHGIASLHRPGNQTRSVIVALGFGVFLIGTLYQVQSSLLAATSERLAQMHANVVFFDIQTDQASGVDSLLTEGRAAILNRIPILSVRIGAINGRSLASIVADTGRTIGAPSRERGGGGYRPRAVAREWRATYADTLGANERIVAGRWFGAGQPREGEVSLDSGAATRLRVKLGDVIQWQLQGVPIITRVTSLRSVDRTQLQPAFQVVFPPALVRRAPMQFVVLANASPNEVPALQRTVVGRYPNVSTVDLSLVEATISAVLTKIRAAIEGLTVVCIVLAIPVLFSAVSATRRERLREGVLLKVLGATRRQVGRMLVTEYVVIGALGSLAGVLLSAAAAWALTRFVFDVPFVAVPGKTIGIGALMIAVVVTIGVATAREVFSSTPMAALRE
ncbi:MAG: putative rane protein [Gemmatimonadetes bacterium]|nr:putative rane protein [Gemmatimonadota bacterium]